MSNNFQNHNLEQVRPILNTWTDFIGDCLFTEEMHSIKRLITERYAANKACVPHNQDFFHQFRVTPIDKLKVVKVRRIAVDNRPFMTEQGFMIFAMELSHEQRQDHTFWRRFTDNVIFRLTAFEILFWPEDHLAAEMLENLKARHIVPKGQGLDYVNKWVVDTYGTPFNWNEMKQLS